MFSSQQHAPSFLSSSTADVGETQRAINKACRARGGAYAQYSCKTVSWDDASRGKIGGQLSCWGSNITDTYLQSKDGERLFTVRPDNFDEKLGVVSSAEVALVAGNHVPGGQLAPITLRDFLKNAGTHSSYAGLPDGSDLSDDALDSDCSIRFQTTFLPVDGSRRATLEFCTSAYNYNTRSDRDPRNLLLLSTTQGVAVQADGAGEKKLFHHDVDHSGTIRRCYLEAERSDHKVGAAQNESAAEKADALARGKATASVIGIQSMGTRFNVLMTVQVPLKQKPPARGAMGGGMGFGMGFGGAAFGAPVLQMGFGGGGGGDTLGYAGFAAEEGDFIVQECGFDACAGAAAPVSQSFSFSGGMKARSKGAAKKQPKLGISNAARVSRGSEYDIWGGLELSDDPVRHPDEHITVTVVIYNVCSGGVPTEADVCAAIDDMEALYASCTATGTLNMNTFDMKKEITVQDAADIGNKVATQPPQTTPPSGFVAGFNVFPTAFVPTAVPVPTLVPAQPPLFQPSSTQAPAEVREMASKLPLSHESFLLVHDKCGLEALAQAKAGTASVADAFHIFLLANEFSVQLNGTPSGIAMYNVSCCLAVGARDAEDPGAMLGPQGLSPGANPTEAALDASATWLRSAVAAGYSDVANIAADPDLSLLRERRPGVCNWVKVVARM